MKNIIKKLLISVAALIFSINVFAATEQSLLVANNNPHDVESLQRGARNFMNYCSGCHSAEYVRYEVIASDLGLSDQQVKEYLMFNAQQTFETINTSMLEVDAAGWFGQAPPDLSLMARAKGTDYIYTFLKSFYIDKSSPTGVDNVVLAGTSMPNVLWELQGHQVNLEEDGINHLELEIQGKMSPEEFDFFLRDTVNFLEYMSEPIRNARRALGIKVLFFLAFFLSLAYFLKKEIWKDIK
ncbi:MAG: cytochrome c1 [Woeseiaceae bacterium]|jgi:ubiquinol-cytochrome c reductase cytochrome c1 subunit|nr:cytochrome c1 [Woeseiaceae bacterium]MDG1865255.1 cytochrome c1 [Woeseiaceae bacterium]